MNVTMIQIYGLKLAGVTIGGNFAVTFDWVCNIYGGNSALYVVFTWRVFSIAKRSLVLQFYVNVFNGAEHLGPMTQPSAYDKFTKLLKERSLAIGHYPFQTILEVQLKCVSSL